MYPLIIFRTYKNTTDAKLLAQIALLGFLEGILFFPKFLLRVTLTCFALPENSFAPTAFFGRSIKGKTEAYGAETGPIVSITFPVRLPDSSYSISPLRTLKPASNNLTTNLPLPAKCITSPMSNKPRKGVQSPLYKEIVT